MEGFLIRTRRGLTWRVLGMAGGAAGGMAVVALAFRLPDVQAVVAIFSAGVFAEVAGIWLEERALARRTRGIPSGPLKMLDAEGDVAEACAPVGKVRIGLEVWSARTGRPGAIPAGQRVVVRDIDDRTLVVEPVRRGAGRQAGETARVVAGRERSSDRDDRRQAVRE